MGSMLMRLAPLTTTGVGSLPFTRPGEAARHAVHGYELPFCPQLPRAYGDMISEWLGADPGGCGWAPDRDRQLPAVWDDFILELERHPPSHGVVKLQVTGPLTLAMALECGERSLSAVTEMAGEVSTWLSAAVGDQVRGLAELGLAALVIIDEPGLMAAHRAGATPAVWDAIRAASPMWGVHVCGEVPWRLIDAAEPDVICYDLGRFGCIVAAQTVLRRLMRRGGRIMWGAIDPAAVEPATWTAARVAHAARSVAGRRWRTADVLAASLLSGACGTGGVDAGSERELARTLQVAATALRGDPTPLAPRLDRAERLSRRTCAGSPQRSVPRRPYRWTHDEASGNPRRRPRPL
jgi:hypothetical protein